MLVATACAGCTKPRGREPLPPGPPAVSVPADASVVVHIPDAAVITPVVDAAPDADLSGPVEADWEPPVHLRRELTLPYGSPPVTIPFGKSAVLNGIELRYATRTIAPDTRAGSFTIIAKQGRKSIKLHHTTDAEVIVFGAPLMIEAFYGELILTSFELDRTDCNDAIGSLWNYAGLGGSSEFLAVPADADVVEKEGMYRVYYRGVRFTCGTLSGRVYAERM
jgi:hypothetical protein